MGTTTCHVIDSANNGNLQTLRRLQEKRPDRRVPVHFVSSAGVLPSTARTSLISRRRPRSRTSRLRAIGLVEALTLTLRFHGRYLTLAYKGDTWRFGIGMATTTDDKLIKMVRDAGDRYGPAILATSKGRLPFALGLALVWARIGIPKHLRL